MSLSEHERTQFNRLTEIFAAGDPVLQKRLQRKAKHDAVSHFSPEDIWMVAAGTLLIAVFGVVTGFITGNFMQVFPCGLMGYAGFFLWMKYPVKRLGFGRL
jgi:hypothetical protein